MACIDFIDFTAGIPEIVKQISAYKGEDVNGPTSQEFKPLLTQFAKIAPKLISNVNLMIEKGKDKDVEAAVTITVALIQSKLAASSEKLIAELVAAVSGLKDKATFRLRLLGNTLNSLPPAQPVHFATLIQLLKFIQENNLTDYAVKYASVIDTLLNTWNYDAQKRRDSLVLLASILKTAGKSKEFQKVILLYLAAVTTDDVNAELVAKAVADSIRMSGNYNFDDIAELAPVVATLKSNGQYAKLYELVTVLSKPSVADYQQFYNANQDVLAAYELTNEDVLFKVRVMSLCRLFSETTDSVSYATVARTLQISEDEVDTWVVRLVGLKLAHVKLDQYNKMVSISSATQCVFGREQWEHLGSRLGSWKHSIDTLLQSLRAAKAHQQPSQ